MFALVFVFVFLLVFVLLFVLVYAFVHVYVLVFCACIYVSVRSNQSLQPALGPGQCTAPEARAATRFRV